MSDDLNSLNDVNYLVDNTVLVGFQADFDRISGKLNPPAWIGGVPIVHHTPTNQYFYGQIINEGNIFPKADFSDRHGEYILARIKDRSSSFALLVPQNGQVPAFAEAFGFYANKDMVEPVQEDLASIVSPLQYTGIIKETVNVGTLVGFGTIEKIKKTGINWNQALRPIIDSRLKRYLSSDQTKDESLWKLARGSYFLANPKLFGNFNAKQAEADTLRLLSAEKKDQNDLVRLDWWRDYSGNADASLEDLNQKLKTFKEELLSK